MAPPYARFRSGNVGLRSWYGNQSLGYPMIVRNENT
jgi:hypothetical protein